MLILDSLNQLPDNHGLLGQRWFISFKDTKQCAKRYKISTCYASYEESYGQEVLGAIVSVVFWI